MINKNGISVDEAVALMELDNQADIYDLIFRAAKVRQENCGNRIHTCAIINAKSGNCGENCAFCPQSVFSSSAIDKYPLKSKEEMLEKSLEAARGKARSFSIVTSGRSVSDQKELDAICDSVNEIRSKSGIGVCASLGTLSRESLEQLCKAGCSSYHHNLEASASFYPEICTTRTFEDNVATLKDARAAGMKLCSGGLFGLGESNAQRVELFETLRELEVDSAPVNFLNAIPGTRIEPHVKALQPLECLKIIAVARLMMPACQIRVCGGREKNLRDMQSWIFAAGASAVMIGSYLTTGGRKIEDDLQMIEDAGMVLA